MDGFTRAAKIRTKTGKTNRPIAKLYPLEVTAVNEPTDTPVTNDDTVPNVQASENVTPKLTRNAAVKARGRIKSWTETLSEAPEDDND